jgi:hypothetical protein
LSFFISITPVSYGPPRLGSCHARASNRGLPVSLALTPASLSVAGRRPTANIVRQPRIHSLQSARAA